MKVRGIGWGIGGMAALGVVGLLASSMCSRSGSSGISPLKGTEIRLESYSDSQISIQGILGQEVDLKLALNQRLQFTSDPGVTQSARIITDTCFVDGSASQVFPMEGIEEALKSFSADMSMRPTGEVISLTPNEEGNLSPLAQNIISSQVWSIQAAGPMGYTLPVDPLQPGKSWTGAADLMDAVRETTADYITPSEAFASYTFTYVGEVEREGKRVLHIKRKGEGRIKQEMNVDGMGKDSQSTTTTMTSEGDIYLDPQTKLLVYSESSDVANIDFGQFKMVQKTKLTVKGSKAF